MATNFVILDQQPIVLEGIRLHVAQIYPDAKFLYVGSSIDEALRYVGKQKVRTTGAPLLLYTP